MSESDERNMNTIQMNKPGKHDQQETNNHNPNKALESVEFIRPILQTHTDANYLHNFSKRIVRIEYPGLVNDSAMAIKTLGGLHEIERAVVDHRNKLELHFRPENKFSKPCIADRDLNTGVLIRIKHNTNVEQNASCQYEIIGVTTLNFKFNRICDFQYLPIVSVNKENGNVKHEYIYDKILPKPLPTLKWFLSKDSIEQPNFCIPTNFARFDISQNKLYLNAGERFGSNVRPEIVKLIENTKPVKRSKAVSTKQISIFINFQVANAQIPDQPLTYTMELIKERNLESMYKTVRKLFEERPIWSKVAIQYKTGLTSEHAKIVLPAVAYFCHMGPWRMTWVRYEYNPQKDYNSRIYQTLDYRIRATEGTKIKVNAKRSYTSKTLFYFPNSNVKKFSLKDGISTPHQNYVIEERSFILRPNCIPPARQMFYQYCDILIPEIQEMVSRLPKLPAGTKCDLKNGWLPINFTEQCREIVNKYVMDQVQEELLEDTIKLQQSTQLHQGDETDNIKEDSASYCSKMLSNIKKGIYKSVNVPSKSGKSGTQSSSTDTTNPIHEIDLIEDIGDDELEQINADDVVNSIPERMDENSDDEHLSQVSDLDIDMEALEEVNKMVAGVKEDDEVDAVASYLKTKI